MKRIAISIVFFWFVWNLSAGTVVKIASKEGRRLTISKGARQGVKKGMTGWVQKLMSQGGEKVPIILGKFVVQEVSAKISRLYIKELAKNADPAEAQQVEFEADLKKQPSTSEIIERLKAEWLKRIEKKDYKGAETKIRRAVRLGYKAPETRLLLTGLDMLNSSQIQVKDYLRYKEQAPGGPLLPHLREMLYTLYPGLPPEAYFHDIRNIEKNARGFYELEFKNAHRMIYIPGLNLFVDKYEVSNRHYLKFAGSQGNKPRPIKLSTLENYPYCCGEPPRRCRV